MGTDAGRSRLSLVVPTRDVVPGVYVLGMHRSGTSVLAGVVEKLGLTGGARSSMIAADQFNSDGYWEQRSLVEWHDWVLGLCGGWASAPAPECDLAKTAAVIEDVRGSGERLVRSLYDGPWFMKDPRQCLAMPIWSAILGTDDLSVAVFRDPTDVARSLDRRNTYSTDLSLALWERYCHSLLRGLEGRPCVVVPYEGLTTEPARWVETIAQAISDHIPAAGADSSGRFHDAMALIRPREAPPREARDHDHLASSQRALADVLKGLGGYFDRFSIVSQLPPLSGEGTDIIEQRRRRLNRVRPLIRSSSKIRSNLDRVPSLVRSLGRR
jgi:hypothetical protein